MTIHAYIQTFMCLYYIFKLENFTQWNMILCVPRPSPPNPLCSPYHVLLQTSGLLFLCLWLPIKSSCYCPYVHGCGDCSEAREIYQWSCTPLSPHTFSWLFGSLSFWLSLGSASSPQAWLNKILRCECVTPEFLCWKHNPQILTLVAFLDVAFEKNLASFEVMRAKAPW